LTWALRGLGILDLLAFVPVVLPLSWIATIHSDIGLGSFPPGPIVGYLARSASAMYFVQGLLLLFVSADVARYRPVIRFLAAVAVLHGLALVMIDVAEGMPLWWTLSEGPVYSCAGVLIGILARGETKPVECR
jgi:hypothetical protein